MSDVIIDTNVAVIANHQNVNVVARCKDNCIKFLIEVIKDHVVLVDMGDEIRREYANALKVGRPYQLGAQFLLHILQNQFDDKKVRRIKLAKNSSGNFVDFPETSDLEKFDRSDRKFAALARKSKKPVTNATDSDWVHHCEALKKHGIQVDFLCGPKINLWFKEK